MPTRLTIPPMARAVPNTVSTDRTFRPIRFFTTTFRNSMAAGPSSSHHPGDTVLRRFQLVVVHQPFFESPEEARRKLHMRGMLEKRLQSLHVVEFEDGGV